MIPTTPYLCAGLVIIAVASVVIIYACCHLSGTITQQEERNLTASPLDSGDDG